ncbi:hypothetical protein Tco_0455607 [Tanacetum coccineum]
MNGHPVIKALQTPLTLDVKVQYHCRLFESRGFLLLVGKDNACSRHLTIYDKGNMYSEWSVKYIVNLDDIIKPFPKRWSIWRILYCIVLEEREEYSFLMMELDKKVVQYKIVFGHGGSGGELCLDPSSGLVVVVPAVDLVPIVRAILVDVVQVAGLVQIVLVVFVEVIQEDLVVEVVDLVALEKTQTSPNMFAGEMQKCSKDNLKLYLEEVAQRYLRFYYSSPSFRHFAARTAREY